MSGEHKTIPVQVWADVDDGIAPLVKYLNTIPGLRTHASCQGTIGEGGAEPYQAYVLVSYQTEAAEMRLRQEFDCTEVFMSTARVHPREGWIAPPELCKECGAIPCRLEMDSALVSRTESRLADQGEVPNFHAKLFEKLNGLVNAYRAKRKVDGGGAYPRPWSAADHLKWDAEVERLELELNDIEYRAARPDRERS
jgi:hypothetical protein